MFVWVNKIVNRKIDDKLIFIKVLFLLFTFKFLWNIFFKEYTYVFLLILIYSYLNIISIFFDIYALFCYATLKKFIRIK